MYDIEAVRRLFREFQFEPGSGFRCDLVQYPSTAEGVPNFAVRAYRSTFDSLTEQQKLLISEQISRLIQDIRIFMVNCVLEVWDVPGKPDSRN